MDPRERYEDAIEAFHAAFDGRQSEIWTTTPAVVQSFDPDEITVTVQPVIRSQQTAADGTTAWVTLPLLIHCPVQFPSGGGWTLTFPLTEGDEGLVHFSSRCIDAWWQSGGIQNQIEIRMHDLSDGFFAPKVWSQPNVIPNVSTTSAQLRSDDGQAYLELAPQHAINIVTPGNLGATVGGNLTANVTGNADLTAAQIKLNGPVTINGTLEVTDAATLNSTLNVGGDITASGDVTASGEGTFAGHTVGEHTHEVIAVGSPTATPIG